MLSYYKPKNKFLSKYIEGYYFLRNSDKDFSLSYYTFPNNYQIVTCAFGSQIMMESNNLICHHNEDAGFISTLTYNYSSPIKIQYYGKVNEVTVYFKPLGLNYFIDHIEKYYLGDNFVHFLPSVDFESEMKKILLQTTIEKAIETFENYWLNHFKNFDLEKVEKIIELLDKMNVHQVAEELMISRQQIHKTF